MSASSLGLLTWGLQIDKDGHRDYTAVFLVECTDPDDGPFTVSGASGLPVTGAGWTYGNDNDPYALCWPTMGLKAVIDREQNLHWEVTCTFSTKPLKRCQDSSITNPLAEPQKVSGSFVEYTKEVWVDKDNGPIQNSALEPFSLPKVDHRPTVTIEQNVASLGLDVISEMIGTINDSELWGLDRHCIMLRNVSWSRQLYGTCTYYYTRRLEFDIKFETHCGVDIIDQGFRRIKGEWVNGVWQQDAAAAAANPKDPVKHFVRITDPNEQPVPTKTWLKDGDVKPPGQPAEILDVFELYEESNFLQLGIPTSF